MNPEKLKPHELESIRKLTSTVTDLHARLTAAALEERGITPDSLREMSYADYNAAFQDTLVGAIDYHDSGVHSASILNGSHFQLRESGNWSVEEFGIESTPEKEVQIALSPMKIIEIELYTDELQSLGLARVFLYPDTPPLVLHIDSLGESASSEGHDPTGLMAASHAQEHHSTGNSLLSGAACEAIISAIERSSPSLAEFDQS